MKKIFSTSLLFSCFLFLSLITSGHCLSSKPTLETHPPTLTVFTTEDNLAHYSAMELVLKIEQANKDMTKDNRKVAIVIVLPTRTSQHRFYRHLTKILNERRVDLSKVATFNLDGYYRLKPTDPHYCESYATYMKTHFLDKILYDSVQRPWGLPKDNFRIPNEGTANPIEETREYDRLFRKMVKKANGNCHGYFGIGPNTHLAFKEAAMKISTAKQIFEQQDKLCKFGDFIIDTPDPKYAVQLIHGIIKQHPGEYLSFYFSSHSLLLQKNEIARNCIGNNTTVQENHAIFHQGVSLEIENRIYNVRIYPYLYSQSPTDIVFLSNETIQANSNPHHFSWSQKNMPTRALSMGFAYFLNPHLMKTITIHTPGKKKQAPLQRMLCGPITEESPASLMRKRPGVFVYADKSALPSKLLEKISNLNKTTLVISPSLHTLKSSYPEQQLLPLSQNVFPFSASTRPIAMYL